MRNTEYCHDCRTNTVLSQKGSDHHKIQQVFTENRQNQDAAPEGELTRLEGR